LGKKVVNLKAYRFCGRISISTSILAGRWKWKGTGNGRALEMAGCWKWPVVSLSLLWSGAVDSESDYGLDIADKLLSDIELVWEEDFIYKDSVR
jgi:hypothetical protein